MGTNIYLDVGYCPCCGHAGKEYHVGKFSAGWVFALHLIPEEGLNTLQDWTDLVEAIQRCEDNLSIRDEYGNRMSWNDLLVKIEIRRSGTPLAIRVYDYAGMSSEAQFHRANSSERGPDNLLRSKIDGERCVAHGPKWDGIVGEFS